MKLTHAHKAGDLQRFWWVVLDFVEQDKPGPSSVETVSKRKRATPIAPRVGMYAHTSVPGTTSTTEGTRLNACLSKGLPVS